MVPPFAKVLILKQSTNGIVRIMEVGNPKEALTTGYPKRIALVVDEATVDLLNKSIALYDIGSFSVEPDPTYGRTLVFTPQGEFRYPDSVTTLLHKAIIDAFGFVQCRVIAWNEEHTDFVEFCVEPHGACWIAYKDGIRCFTELEASTAYGGDVTAGS